MASSEGTSSSRPARGVSREDHGGSDGLGLEVVTVTSMDVPLARGQSWAENEAGKGSHPEYPGEWEPGLVNKPALPWHVPEHSSFL